MKRHSLWMAALFCGLMGRSAEAHLRNYLDTYQPYSMEKGRTEMELWTDWREPDGGDGYWFHQTELEFGVTDRYTLGVYGVFIDGQGFSAAKLENRYRLSEPGEWPVDTGLYLEFQKANDHKANDEIEAKILLSKDWGPWNLSVNPILEVENETDISGEDEWELESALALGASYQKLWSRVTPGLELFVAENQTRIVPGVYIDLLPDVRLNVGGGFGLEKAADDFQLKTILELEF